MDIASDLTFYCPSRRRDKPTSILSVATAAHLVPSRSRGGWLLAPTRGSGSSPTWCRLAPSIRSVADADRPGVRVAVVRNHAHGPRLWAASGSTPNRLRAESPDGAFDLLRTGHADVHSQAPARRSSAYSTEAARLAGAGGPATGPTCVAMAVPKDQAGRLAYFSEFVEEAKASGLVRGAIERRRLDAGNHRVAPAGNPNAREVSASRVEKPVILARRATGVS